MPLITLIAGYRPGTSVSPTPPGGKRACARCGFEREWEPRHDRPTRNLCRTCLDVLTSQELQAWDS